MAKVIISVDNNMVANSIALWLESGSAIKSWKHYSQDIIDAIREDEGEDAFPEIDEDPSVDFGDSEDWEMVHTVSLYKE